MYRLTRVTRDLVVCVNGKECSVEELESTQGISEKGRVCWQCAVLCQHDVLCCYRSLLYSDTGRSCGLIIIIIITTTMCELERAVVA
jgi:hypothetical protein